MMNDLGAVVVVGGAGYVGSHTCKALSQAGFRPVVFDNLSNGHEWAVQWGPFVKGELADTALLTEIISANHPVAVLHFAANIEVGDSVKNPLKHYRNNLAGTISLLTAMEAAKVERLIFSSTCAIFGVPLGDTLNEESGRHPINPYGRTKHLVEEMLADLAQHGKLQYAALRYFNAAGADAGGTIGEAHDPETHLIPLAILAALEEGKGDRRLKIFGDDFPTPDGTPVRDYIHVNDLATAHVAALQYLLAGKPSDGFNIGSGEGHSVLQVIEGLKTLGLSVPLDKVGRRKGDPPRLVADPAKANRVLNWRTEQSDLANILSTAVAWHRRRFARAN